MAPGRDSPMPVAVALLEHEIIVARGHGKLTWFLRDGDAWRAVGALPQATLNTRDAAPGTVWERVVELSLFPGTRLLRIESRPGETPHRDPLDYLRREIRAVPRAVRRTEFVVGKRGELVPAREVADPDLRTQKKAPRR